MSSQKLAFYFLIIASIVGVSVIFIRRYSQATCPQEEKQVCSFINQNKRNNMIQISGTYLSIRPDHDELQTDWVMDRDISSIVIRKQQESILEGIFAEKYIYVKDMKDGEWWREERYQVENAIQELPFNPEVFFNDFVQLITDAKTVFTYVNEVNCMDEECYRYQLKSADMAEDDQLFVMFSKKTSQLRSLVSVTENGRGELQVVYNDESLEEPDTVKIVPAGRNILLEYVTLRDQEEDKNYEYLRQFQQERIESEGTDVIQYLEETPTPQLESSISL